MVSINISRIALDENRACVKIWMKGITDNDRRSAHVHLTTNGDKAAHLHVDMHKRFANLLSKDLTESEKDILIVLLNEAIQSIP